MCLVNVICSPSFVKQFFICISIFKVSVSFDHMLTIFCLLVCIFASNTISSTYNKLSTVMGSILGVFQYNQYFVTIKILILYAALFISFAANSIKHLIMVSFSCSIFMTRSFPVNFFVEYFFLTFIMSVTVVLANRFQLYFLFLSLISPEGFTFVA